MFVESGNSKNFRSSFDSEVLPEASASLSQDIKGTSVQDPSLTSQARPNALGKRSVDISISVVCIVFFGPLMLIIAFLLKVTEKGPIFFSHHRIGYGGATFKCLKFRTMVQDAETLLAAYLEADEAARREWNERHKLTCDPRITWLGQFLRVSSLDELPQFINVLRGEMSIVGPRPIVENERDRYGRYFADYCIVRPGLTGLWQVSGRNDTTYRRRVALDVVYCRNFSFALDLWVICKTPWAVIKRSGVY